MLNRRLKQRLTLLGLGIASLLLILLFGKAEEADASSVERDGSSPIISQW